MALIISTVVFQLLRPESLSSVIADMQDHTKDGGYHFIITHWQVLSYQEQPGTFHRKDNNGHPIQAVFATLLACKR
ncbi:MAG: hypothetical protein AAFV85_09035 [Cyanobacteria bacterium J06634_6]